MHYNNWNLYINKLNDHILDLILISFKFQEVSNNDIIVLTYIITWDTNRK